MKTTVKMTGMVFGATHTCNIEVEGTPRDFFGDKTLETLFQLESGFIPDGEIEVLITFSRQTPFGVAGFESYSVERAIKEGERFANFNDDEMVAEALKQLPPPEELLKTAIKARKQKDIKKALDIGRLFCTVSKLVGAAVSLQQFVALVEKKVQEEGTSPL